MVSITDFTSAFEKILTPNVEMLKGEIKALDTKIDSVRNSVEELDKRLTNKIDEMDKRLTTRIDALSEKMDIIKDVEQVKANLTQFTEQVQARLTQLEARH